MNNSDHTPFTDLEAAIEEADFRTLTERKKFVVVDSGGVMHVLPLKQANPAAVICHSAINA